LVVLARAANARAWAARSASWAPTGASSSARRPCTTASSSPDSSMTAPRRHGQPAVSRVRSDPVEPPRVRSRGPRPRGPAPDYLHAPVDALRHHPGCRLPRRRPHRRGRCRGGQGLAQVVERQARLPGTAPSALGRGAHAAGAAKRRRGGGAVREALALTTELLEIARCRLSLARLHGRIDGRARGAEHLATAVALFRQLGASFWAELAEAELGRPGRRCCQERDECRRRACFPAGRTLSEPGRKNTRTF